MNKLQKTLFAVLAIVGILLTLQINDALAIEGFWKFKFNNTNEQTLALIKQLKDSGKISNGGAHTGGKSFYVQDFKISGKTYSIEIFKGPHFQSDIDVYDRVIVLYPASGNAYKNWRNEQQFDSAVESIINNISKSHGNYTDAIPSTEGESDMKWNRVKYVWEFEDSAIELEAKKTIFEGNFDSAEMMIRYCRMAKGAVKF